MHSPISDHARVRMQQRGISPTALELLLDYGHEVHDHRGCRIVNSARTFSSASVHLSERLTAT